MANDDGKTVREAQSSRGESPEERADRKWGDLLQELRVMQTGVQLMAAFLLTLPFQERFSSLDTVQRTTYLALVVLAGSTTALAMTPVAVHRRLSGRFVKERVVEAGHRLVQLTIGCVALLVVGITGFVFDIVAGRTPAVAATTAMSAVAVALLLVLPTRVTGD